MYGDYAKHDTLQSSTLLKCLPRRRIIPELPNEPPLLDMSKFHAQPIFAILYLGGEVLITLMLACRYAMELIIHAIANIRRLRTGSASGRPRTNGASIGIESAFVVKKLTGLHSYRLSCLSLTTYHIDS